MKLQQVLYLDTETEPIVPGKPPVFVAAGYYETFWNVESPSFAKIVPKAMTPRAVKITQDKEEIRHRVMGADVVVAHNLAFDLQVLGLGDWALRLDPKPHCNRLTCTMLLDGLMRLATTDCEGESVLRTLEAVAGGQKAVSGPGSRSPRSRRTICSKTWCW